MQLFSHSARGVNTNSAGSSAATGPMGCRRGGGPPTASNYKCDSDRLIRDTSACSKRQSKLKKSVIITEILITGFSVLDKRATTSDVNLILFNIAWILITTRCVISIAVNLTC